VGPPSDTDQPPAPPEVVSAPSEAPLIAIATPSPAIAFAEPVKAVPQQQTLVTTPTKVAPAPDSPKRLTFGEGEGRQPSPEYPREAQLAHQQGSVLVRFIVGEDGRVQSAAVQTPCPFAMLNQAAVRGVRDSWRFARGTVRTYEVTIIYTLKSR
jgi:protein TonB